MPDPDSMTLGDIEARLERYEHNVTEQSHSADSEQRGGAEPISKPPAMDARAVRARVGYA